MLQRRALYQGFLTCATLRTFVADRLSLRDGSVDLLHRLGLFLPTTEQSLWVHGEGLGEFHAAGPLLRRLRDAHPGLRLVLTTSRPCTALWLGKHFPDAICLPPPWDVPGTARRFFSQLHPRLLLLLEFHDGFGPAVLKFARQAGVPVAVVNGRALPPTGPLRFRAAGCLGLTWWAAGLIDRFCVQSEEMTARLTDWRVELQRVFVTGNLKFDVRARPYG